MLGCYRILDLTDEKGFLCGRALSDFGAEVIKIEKPGGDRSRLKGPFFHDSGHPEQNLTWFAFNANKKGITLDIENAEGRELFKKLVKTADVVIESFPPGYLDKLNLGYHSLSEVKPGIILASISGFGQEGPYRDFKAPDIVARAMGGLVYTTGYEDRPPLTPGYEHTYSIAAMYAAVGIMIALSHRAQTGLGQHIDASVQQACVVIASAEIEGPYALFGRVLSRHGRARGSVTLKDGTIFYNPLLWECKDGDIAFNLLINPTSVKANLALMEGLKRDGIDIKFLNNWQWDKQGWKDMSLEQAKEVVNIIGQFFKKYTKAELLEMAIKNRFQLGPCNNAADVLSHPQLAERNFWKDIYYPELETSFKYPGWAVKMSEEDCGPRFRSPRVGEHNAEIYKELNLSDARMNELKSSGII
ncbi:MAG TPA: CoA transferase [Dehalococcoidales bacterium]|nr:CoA transferase [Dehalococcoidales bacterium]